jgi:hypothetical protein
MNATIEGMRCPECGKKLTEVTASKANHLACFTKGCGYCEISYSVPTIKLRKSGVELTASKKKGD